MRSFLGKVNNYMVERAMCCIEDNQGVYEIAYLFLFFCNLEHFFRIQNMVNTHLKDLMDHKRNLQILNF